MKLLAIEWLKLKGSRVFWLCMALYILSMVLLLAGFGSISITQNQGEGQNAMLQMKSFGEAGFYKLPYLWHHITYISGFFKLIPTFILIYFISSEYSYRTMRQNIIDGLSRAEFYSSKLLSALLFAVLSTLIIALSGLVFALLYNEGLTVSRLFSGSEYLLAFFTEVLFMMVFAIFLTLLFKRSTISIIVILAYYFIAEPLLGMALNHYLSPRAGSYLPTAPSRELILQPFTRLFQLDSTLGLTSAQGLSWRYLFFSLLYSLIFALGGYYAILKRRDL